MENRENIVTGSPWEDRVGYSRAIVAGPNVFISGTTAVDENGRIISPGNAALQARFIFRKLEKVLDKAGARWQDVVRTRMYLTDIDQWEAVGKVHGEYFEKIKPAATMVEVSRLIHPDLVIEIEIDAIIGNNERA